jgi:SnoaL-like domain
MTDRDAVQRWVQGYTRAWDSNVPDDVMTLFTADAEYRFAPSEEPAVGHDAIVTRWLDDADAPGDHTFHWHLLALDGDLAVIQGRTEYARGTSYDNLWILDLAPDGRARAFTEWYMTPPGP